MGHPAPLDDDFELHDLGDAPVVALTDLRRARRSNRASEVDIFDAFYQAYLTAIGCGIAVLLLSDVVGDRRMSPDEVHRIISNGPAVLGAAIALVVAGGLRSGARGGPLVLPAAEVRHVLMAPVPRGQALRSPAIRQVRFISFVGTVAGAIVGVLAARRLPGGVAIWVLCAAGTGMAMGLLVTGTALVVSGRRLRPLPALAAMVVVLAWSGADIVLGTRTSPATLLGVVALWPLKFSALGVVGVVLPLVLAGVGIFAVGGTSIEAAERRASLASQIRFALTLQDLRTVVLLRRQLNQERPRNRPWVRLSRLSRGRTLVWRRDLRGLARWPATRLIRVAALGAIAGLSLAGVWAGTTPLIVVAALALYLAGLDALEPLAQEIDHPDIPASTPVELGWLRLAHVPASMSAMVVVAIIGWAAAFAVGPTDLVGPVGAALIFPAALLATAGGAISIVMGPPSADNLMLPMEAAGAKMVLRVLWAPAIVLVGLTPLLIARSSVNRGLAPGPAALSGSIAPVMVGLLAIAWVRFREEVHVWFTPPPAVAGEEK